MLFVQSAGTDKHDAKMIGSVVVSVDQHRVLDFAKVRSLLQTPIETAVRVSGFTAITHFMTISHRLRPPL